jgi:uncharacterized protein (DUF1330 family)
MTAYLIVDTELTDPELYETYKVQAKPIVEKFGGEYLARGGELTLKETDRWTPMRVVVIRFPNMTQAHAFYESEEYQKVLPISRQAAKRTVFFVEGM